MGIGGAFIMPATLSIITNVFPARERGRAIGVWAATAGLGAALGPLTGGFLLEHFYWGSVFLVNLPIVIFGLVAGVFLIPDSKDPSAPRLDPIGAVLSIVGLALGAVRDHRGAPQRLDATRSPSSASSSASSCSAPSPGGSCTPSHPMLDFTFFQNPRFSAASAAITLTFFAMFGSLFLFTPVPAVRARLHAAADRRPPAGRRHPDDDRRPALSPRFVDRVGTKYVVGRGHEPLDRSGCSCCRSSTADSTLLGRSAGGW